jgi:hypothetical protein
MAPPTPPATRPTTAAPHHVSGTFRMLPLYADEDTATTATSTYRHVGCASPTRRPPLGGAGQQSLRGAPREPGTRRQADREPERPTPYGHGGEDYPHRSGHRSAPWLAWVERHGALVDRQGDEGDGPYSDDWHEPPTQPGGDVSEKRADDQCRVAGEKFHDFKPTPVFLRRRSGARPSAKWTPEAVRERRPS